MGGRREGGEIGGKKGGRRKERGRGEGSRDGRTEERTEGVKGEVRKEGVGRRGKRGGKGKTVVESIINHNILKTGPLNISSQNTYTCTCSMCYVKKNWITVL